MPEPAKQTERIRCDFCHQLQVCRRVRKPKRGVFGRITYVEVWLCEIHVYNVEML